MKRVAVFLAFILSAWLGWAQAENLPDFTDLVEKQEATVVNIRATTNAHAAVDVGPNAQGPQENDPMLEFFRRFGIPMTPQGPHGQTEESHSLGSGFIISPDGYILTNTHVVQGADEVMVTLQDKREFKAKVVGVDRKTDVAVIKIDASSLPTVKIGDSSKAKVGEWVVAIGSPFGFESSVTKGIISAKGRSLPQETLVPFIQTDVPINPGNSGGPLFNMKGEVIGINSQIYSRTGGYMGLSFAIPIDVALQVSDQLRATGKVSRGWLGVVIQEVTKELADSFGLGKPRGALVVSVQKGAPAEKAGIHASDIILKFDGKPIATQEDLPRVVSATKAGSTVDVQVWRKGALLDLTATVGEMPSEKMVQKEAPPAKRARTGRAGKLGLTLADLTAQQRKELDITSGVLVEDAAGPASKAGLQNGDVILSINNSEIHSVREFNQVLSHIEPKKMVALLVKRGGDSQFITLKPE
ncbi:MAG: DegQ family serine endoprotease [Betaproteobacteria bacterium]|nr:DegQ family serine endoprotease [Betaproteobacteria bacterium]MDE2622597.1 DegQ family serine endoprotease [Betaproteobacteria bacterium]